MYSPIRHQRRLDLQLALPAALGSLGTQGEIAAQMAIISANFLEFSSFFHGTFEVALPSSKRPVYRLRTCSGQWPAAAGSCLCSGMTAAGLKPSTSICPFDVKFSIKAVSIDSLPNPRIIIKNVSTIFMCHTTKR